MPFRLLNFRLCLSKVLKKGNALWIGPLDEYAPQYLLSGVAAAGGLYIVVRILNSGADGQFRCQACLWQYQYILFGDGVAIYADGAGIPGEDRVVLDFRAGTPSRADGFMLPIAADANVPDGRVAALLALAGHAANPKPALLLRNFLGRFQCWKCGAQGPATAI